MTPPRTIDPGSEPASTDVHPRTLGWVRNAAMAMGGSNQSLFLIGVLLLAQGSAAIPLLFVGLVLSLAAMPGWIELILMFPNRVGGIAAVCGEAFRPYSAVLANLAGTCYWWGWVPTCGLTALLSAAALHVWYLPAVPVTLLAVVIVLIFAGVNLLGIRKATTVSVVIASGAAALAFLSVVIPVMAGNVDWQQATTFSLKSPFTGLFGGLTSAMAGLYLIGFAAPAFEAAGCHVGETRDPNRNIPRAFYASAAMAVLFFVAVPVVWIGVLGQPGLEGDLSTTLGPTFGPLLGGAARAAGVWLITLNMFSGTLQPLAGASRTLAQLAEDGLLPRSFGRRSKRDVPWVATMLTAAMSIVFLLMGDPVWMIAAANFTYLIGICLPSVAVWLLRRHSPDLKRPYRALRGMIMAGVLAAMAWGLAAVLGFEQFGLPTVVFGVALAYSGAALYSMRIRQDRKRSGEKKSHSSLHKKLTGAMLLVLTLDSAGYLIAVNSVVTGDEAVNSVLADIFVAVALVTVAVGLILPGLIAHAVTQIADGAKRLATGTLADLTWGMERLAAGDLEAARPIVETEYVVVHSADELGDMASSFNTMQDEVARAASALGGAREELALARDQVLNTTRLKSEFLATMSHEIRTPMNGVIGLTSMLLDTGLDETQRQYAEGVRGAGDALLAIINDILDFSKLEAGKVELEDTAFEPRRLVDEVALLLADTAHSKGLELITQCAADVPMELRGDPGRIRQVLLNLASNGVKFTTSGEVIIRARLVNGPSPQVRFEVCDTGIGIDPNDQDRLFELFSQADASTTRRYGGTGLGLAICRRLAEAMGEGIVLTSELGRGSTFAFSIPLVDPVPGAESPADDDLAGVRVLVVDDNAANRQVLSGQLQDWRMVVETVPDAATALNLLKRSALDGHPYSIAIVDMGMAAPNGLQLAEHIAAERALAGTRTLLLISGTAVSREDMQRAGISAWLAKPVRFSALHERLTLLANAQPAESPVTTAAISTAHADSRGRVLVAEDNRINQMVATALLARLGYDFDVVANGLEAISAVNTQHYVAVLMDCHMPDMDGYAATGEIRRTEPPGQHIPIIALTAGAMAEDRKNCLAAGMDDYLSKPISLAALKHTLDVWAELPAVLLPAQRRGDEPTGAEPRPTASTG